jgi:hypothetical protein
MTEKEAAKLAAILKGHEAEVEEAARHARPLFTGGLPEFLDPPAFTAWVRGWTDRALHGGFIDDLRPGAALRAKDMRDLAPGLLAPGHYYLEAEDLPASVEKVGPFLRDLIARPAAPQDSSRKSGDAVAHAAKNLGDLFELAERVWKLGEISVELYQHALLGDAPACRPLIECIDDHAIRNDVIKTIALLQIVWAAADVQRVAAYCNHKVQLRYVPFFLRPFVRKGTAAEYLGLLQKMQHLRLRLIDHRTLAQVFNKKRARVTNKGVVGAALENIVAPLEDALSPQDISDITQRENWMTAEANGAIAAVQAQIAQHGCKKGSEQLTRFQVRHAGLSELAALVVTSYRFAEREKAMLGIIADPTTPDGLWDMKMRRFPKQIDDALLARAAAIHDSYRRHILRDNQLNDNTADDRAAGQYARTATAQAQVFLVTLGAATFDTTGRMDRAGLKGGEYFAAHMLDLSYRVRSRVW